MKKKINQFIIGLLLGDFITAFFHWFGDNYLEPTKIKNRFLKKIAFDNEMHHYIPRTILSVSYFDNIKKSLSLSLIVLILLSFFFREFLNKNLILIFTCLSITSLSNLIHRFSHLRNEELNIFIKFLQNTGIFINHEEHKIHHNFNTKIKYSGINKYTNYLYDNLGIWKIFERIIYIIFKIKPTTKRKVVDYSHLYDYKLKKYSKDKIPKILNKEELIYYRNKLKKYLEKKYDCVI
jgi:hypothetical protein